MYKVFPIIAWRSPSVFLIFYLIFIAFMFKSVVQFRRTCRLCVLHRNSFHRWYERKSLYSSSISIKNKDIVIPLEPPTWDKWEYGTFPVDGINSTVTTVTKDGQTKSKLVRKLKPNLLEDNDDEWRVVNNEKLQFDPLWEHLSKDEVARALGQVEPFVTESRKEKMNSILSQRTKNVRFVFENPSNANNVWAALRTLDSFGVQFIDIVFNNETYICEWRKSTMGAALGSQKWMTLKQHDNTTDCLTLLKKEGYTIVASDLQASSLRSDKIDWRNLTGLTDKKFKDSINGKVVIVMGNENTGITQLTRDMADHLLYIPMKGFAESLNLSVAVAVLCTQLDQQLMLHPGLGQDTSDRILLTWYCRTVRGSKKILNRANIPVPFDSMFERINNVTTRP